MSEEHEQKTVLTKIGVMLLLRYPLVAELGEERRDRHADHVRHGGHVHDADVEALLELVVVDGMPWLASIITQLWSLRAQLFVALRRVASRRVVCWACVHGATIYALLATRQFCLLVSFRPLAHVRRPLIFVQPLWPH